VVVHRSRWGQVAVVLVLLVGIFATSVRAAEAAAPTSAAPLFSRGVPWYARGVGGPLTLPMIIGGVGYEAYRFYKNTMYLDTGLGDDPYCGTNSVGARFLEACLQVVGTQGGFWRYEMTVSADGSPPQELTNFRVIGTGEGPWTRPNDGATDYSIRQTQTEVLPYPGGVVQGAFNNGYCYDCGASDFQRQYHYLTPTHVDVTFRNASNTAIQWEGTNSVRIHLQQAVVEPTQPDPHIAYQEVECWNPTTDAYTYHVVTGGVVGYEDGHLIYDYGAFECPEGSVLVGMDAYLEREDGTGQREKVYGWEPSQDWWDAMEDQDLATCLLLEGTDVACSLGVFKKVPQTSGEVGWEGLQECSPYVGNCANWWFEPTRSDMYQCMWHTASFATSVALPLTECAELAWFYNPEHAYQIVPSPSTVPSPWPQQDPWSPGQPQPWPNPIPQPGSDPTTWPWPNPSPQPNPELYPTPQPGGYPWPGTSTPTQPGTGPGTGTGTVTLPDPTPSQDPDNCWAGTLSWNPLDWVLTPVKCALAWAFVPSEATWTNMQDLGQHAATRVPFSWFADAFGWFEPLQGTGSACLQLSFPVLGETVTAVDSCTPGPAEGWIMARRAVLSVVTYGLLVVPLAWWAWRQYAPGSQGNA
jgi:hypothetical protein